MRVNDDEVEAGLSGTRAEGKGRELMARAFTALEPHPAESD